MKKKTALPQSKAQIRWARRHFIKQALAASAALGLTTACRIRETNRRASVDPEAVKKFGASLKGQLVLPTDPAYEGARRVFYWNPKTERRPVFVARCAHAEDVLRTVEFARNLGLEVAVRAGGHSFKGWSTSSGVVIDLSGMKRITIDPIQRVARLEGGVLGGEAVLAAAQHGLAPVLGQCPMVGASGVLLGGGLGWLAGLHGAASDNLLLARLVTADGQMLSVDAKSSPDLFWALQGGGGNLGVTTSLDCRLHPVGPVTAGEFHYPVREAGTILRFFRDLMAEAPDSFQATLNLTHGDAGVFVSFCHAGEQDEAEGLLKSFRTVATPVKVTAKRQNFVDLAGRPAPRKPGDPPPPTFRFIQGICRASLSDEVIDLTLDRFLQSPAETVIGVSHYMHGEVCRVAPGATAFPLRQPGTIHMRIGVDWTDATASEHLMSSAEETWRLLRPSQGERSYANYQTYEGEGTSLAVYGENHFRLAAIKRKYDPANFFHRNSNIKPAAV